MKTNNLKTNNKISLIIPAFNEEKTIEFVIRTCAKQPIVSQIIAVNDGSSDNTKKILNKLLKDKPLKQQTDFVVAHHSINKGKGAAIRTGISKAKSKYLMIQDADLEYSPRDIGRLYKKAEGSKDGIVFGTRTSNRKKGYLLAQLGNFYLDIMFNLLFGLRLSDAYTCYKLMPRKVWNRLNLKRSGFEIDAELISKLGVLGYDIEEVPISYHPRKYSEGKKIKWTDLLKATKTALKIFLSKDV